MAVEFERRALLGTVGLGGIGWLVFGASQGEATTRFEVVHTPAEWQRILGPQRYPILRQRRTEIPYTSPLNKEHRRGAFICAGCFIGILWCM